MQPEDRYRSFRVRTISTIVLISTFVGVIAAGHVPLMLMILGIQVRFLNAVITPDWSEVRIIVLY